MYGIWCVDRVVSATMDCIAIATNHHSFLWGAPSQGYARIICIWLKVLARS